MKRRPADRQLEVLADLFREYLMPERGVEILELQPLLALLGRPSARALLRKAA